MSFYALLKLRGFLTIIRTLIFSCTYLCAFPTFIAVYHISFSLFTNPLTLSYLYSQFTLTLSVIPRYFPATVTSILKAALIVRQLKGYPSSCLIHRLMRKEGTYSILPHVNSLPIIPQIATRANKDASFHGAGHAKGT